MSQFSIFIVLQLLCYIGFAQEFKTDIEEKQSYQVDGENIVFVGHATSFWDQSRKTEPATRKIIRLGRKHQWPVIATVAKQLTEEAYNVQQHYFTQPEIDLMISSRAGGHRLLIPQAKNIFIVGGNLNRCLCEGIRDLVYGFFDSKNFSEVNLYLITDGIYAAYGPYSPVKDEKVALEFSTLFFGPAFYCPLQNWGRATEKRKVMPDTFLSVYLHQKHLGDIDLEPKDGVSLGALKKKINIKFITSDEIEAVIQQIEP